MIRRLKRGALRLTNHFAQLGPRKLQADKVPMASEWEAPGTMGKTDLYHAVWEKKRQPDPAGALAYAWETLGLVPFSFIGPGVSVRQFRAFDHTSKPSYGLQAVWLDGIPLQAGTFELTGLVDQTGTPAESLPSTLFNKPFASPDPFAVM